MTISSSHLLKFCHTKYNFILLIKSLLCFMVQNVAKFWLKILKARHIHFSVYYEISSQKRNLYYGSHLLSLVGTYMPLISSYINSCTSILS
ncbi:hypothetical protein AQUCO_00400424v1 [Aquilegia coerulea]|uniref:Uncharacterized protein n=1 Tax=Aquilegia coerulea TaxID=218851 RepID=A0A2G5EUX5_AQUCA|nr:hypothetical protein AQUCO_00400424v1 [Aquilegia coerulea]